MSALSIMQDERNMIKMFEHSTAKRIAFQTALLCQPQDSDGMQHLLTERSRDGRELHVALK